MAGTLSVQKIQGLASSATPTVVEVSSGHVLHAPGHVIQTINGTSTAEATTTSNSYQDTPLFASITPKFSTSKILINTTFMSGNPTSNYNIYYALFRDSTNLAADAAGGMHINIGITGNSNQATYHMGGRCAITHLDSPNSTSSITYRVKFANITNGQSCYFNRNANGDAATRTFCTIILQEIAQ